MGGTRSTNPTGEIAVLENAFVNLEVLDEMVQEHMQTKVSWHSYI